MKHYKTQTIKIKKGKGFAIINCDEFDPEIHEEFGKKAPAKTTTKTTT